MPPVPERRLLARVFGLSVLVLFLEMLLIRWIGTEVRVFAYLQNGVLVAAFLGLGLGCRNARRPARLLPALVALLLLTLVIRDPLRWGVGEALTRGLVAFQDAGVWAASQSGATTGPALRWLQVGLSLLATLGLLAAVALTFHPLGQWLGRWMDGCARPIAAYTANILGSLLGIAAFDALTLAEQPPPIWLLAAAVGLVALAPLGEEPRSARWAVAVLGLLLPVLAWTSDGAVWSPYQKLRVTPLSSVWPWLATSAGAATCGEQISVNNTAYQTLIDLDPAHLAQRPELYPPSDVATSHYVLPYTLLGQPGSVLVVGAGAGNDVAAALRAGASRVRAVEIDPVIVRLGRERHPMRPYASPRVEVVIEDARAFFQADTRTYDVIWFGLLDSHTNPSAYTNVRLDHFVYTRESFTAMRRLLAPSGVVVLFFAPETAWVAERLVALMTETFDAPPLAMAVRSSTPCLGWGGLLLLGGSPERLAGVRARAAADADLNARLIAAQAWPRNTPPTSDDWPYLYLERPGLPRYHLLVGAACLLLGLILRRRLFRAGEDVDAPMLLLGAGFMLLEVSGVSRAALLFGTTWTVNAYVVGAMLAMALLANLAASRLTIDATGWPFFGLVASLLALALAPMQQLQGLPLPARVLAGAGFLALPVFFSGLVFVTLWARSGRRDLALGSNLLGALAGGVASMLSMLVGFRLLAVLTLLTYLGAFFVARSSRSRAGA